VTDITPGTGPIGPCATDALAPFGEELVDAAVAAYLTMASCQELADRETADMLGVAMESLDDFARFGHLLSEEDQRGFLEDLEEIDEMLGAIREHLVAERD
jgi:hypothetical protein